MASLLNNTYRANVVSGCGNALNADAEAIEFHVGLPYVLPLRPKPLRGIICDNSLAAQ